jgi:hypothetical protein
MSMPRILVFLAVVVSIVAGLHYYLWARLVRDAFEAPWRLRLGLAIAALALIVPASLFVVRALGPRRGAWLAWPAFVWMGAVFIFFCVFLVADVARLFVGVAAWAAKTPFDPSRRAALGRGLAGAQALVGGSLAAFAVWGARRAPKLVTVEVPIARLPQDADGLTIVQLTDVHLGPTLGREFVAELVARVNALAPDVVAITGDLVDGTVDELADAVAPLAELKARHGVYFVTGNHEYFSGAAQWIRHLPTLGVRVLANEHVALPPGVDLAGVHDYHANRDLPAALVGRDASRPLVLLAHQPRQIFEAAKLGVDLQLSGHTHGGQIWPFTYMVYLQQPYVAGLIKHQGAWLYVSRGTGYWGPPMRLGTRAEITKVVLRAA